MTACKRFQSDKLIFTEKNKSKDGFGSLEPETFVQLAPAQAGPE